MPNSAPQKGFLSQMCTLGPALCPMLGKNVHLGHLLILRGLIQSVLIAETQEQILFQTDFNKTDFL